MKYSKVLPLLFTEMKDRKIDFALIGGVALYVHGLERTTFDLDFMILVEEAEPADRMMRDLHYDRTNKTQTFVTYSSEDRDLGRVDFMYAAKDRSRAMLARAEPLTLMGHSIKVLRAEDMIGLKILSSTNDPRRATKDLADIEDLMRRQHAQLDWKLIQEYFDLFGRHKEFKALKRKTR